MATRRKAADVGRMQLCHPGHVGHDVGIAGITDHMPLADDHESGVDRRIRPFQRRRMAGIDHRHPRPVPGDGAARVATCTGDGMAPGLMADQIGIAQTRDRLIPVQRLFPAVFGKHRISRQPGVDQQHGLFDLDPERGMARPEDFRCPAPFGC